MTKDELLKLVTVLQAELDATNRQVEILSDALAESRREVAALKINAALDKKAENARELGLDYEPVPENFIDALRFDVAMRDAAPVQENTMIYRTFEQWMNGNFLEVKEPRKKAYSKDELLLVEMGWNYGYDAGRAVEQALDKKAENARELGLDYEPHKGLLEHMAQATNGRVRIDPVTGDVGIGKPEAQPAQQEPINVAQAYAMAQVCLDLHDAIGCKWGDNVYLAIKQLKQQPAPVQELVLSVDQIYAIADSWVPDLPKGQLCRFAREIEIALAAQPAPVQEPVAWTVSGKITDWSKDFSAYQTKHYTRPVYTPPAAAVQEGRDWSLLEATQESLREHMAEIKRLKEAQPAVPDALNPKDESPAYAAGWNDCRAEMLKGMKP